jgi:hypothetical protein
MNRFSRIEKFNKFILIKKTMTIRKLSFVIIFTNTRGNSSSDFISSNVELYETLFRKMKHQMKLTYEQQSSLIQLFLVHHKLIQLFQDQV